MENSQINITNLISGSINSLLSELFTSIDGNIYSLLDTLAFTNTNIISDDVFKKIFGTPTSIGIILVANSLLLGILIFYCVRLFTSSFSSTQVEQPFQFLLKFLFFSFCINFSYTLCFCFISFNSLLSSSILEIGEYFFEIDIGFTELIKKINATMLISKYSFNVFSFDGVLKIFTSFGIFNLLFSYSLRYILIKIFVLISPFAFLSLINSSTAWFFKSWFKSFLSLLLMQFFISLILLIIFSINFLSNDSLSKLLFLGCIFSLVKSNSYMKEFMGGITTEFSNNFFNMKNKY